MSVLYNTVWKSEMEYRLTSRCYVFVLTAVVFLQLSHQSFGTMFRVTLPEVCYMSMI